MKALYNFLEKDLSENTFKSLLEDYGRKTSFNEGLSRTGFIRFFKGLLATNTKSYLSKVFENLGYTKNLFSYRSRVFRLTFHSEELLSVKTKDALKDNIDFVTNKLLVRKFGTPINDDAPADEEVTALFYFNK